MQDPESLTIEIPIDIVVRLFETGALHIEECRGGDIVSKKQLRLALLAALGHRLGGAS